MNSTTSIITFMEPERVHNRASKEAKKYITEIEKKINTTLDNERKITLDNSFKAGYKTAFTDLLKMVKNQL